MVNALAIPFLQWAERQCCQRFSALLPALGMPAAAASAEDPATDGAEELRAAVNQSFRKPRALPALRRLCGIRHDWSRDLRGGPHLGTFGRCAGRVPKVPRRLRLGADGRCDDWPPVSNRRYADAGRRLLDRHPEGDRHRSTALRSADDARPPRIILVDRSTNTYHLAVSGSIHPSCCASRMDAPTPS